MKALYEYEANAEGELSLQEDEILEVYSKDDDWFLVQSRKEGGKIGYIPGNYVEEVCTHISLNVVSGVLTVVRCLVDLRGGRI